MREPRKMPLEVGERFAVLQLLPEKASFVNMKLIREVKEALMLTSEEQEAVDFKATNDGRIAWDADKAKEVIGDIPFDPKIYVVVMEALQKLDKADELEAKHLSLFEKFVEVKVAEKDEKDEKVVGKVE